MWSKMTYLRRAAILIAGLLIVCCLGAYIGVSASSGLYLPIAPQERAQLGQMTVGQPEIASCVVEAEGLRITALAAGMTEIRSGEETLAQAVCSPNGFVRDEYSGRYTGDTWVQCAVFVFLAGTAAILLWALRRQMRTAFYHYATPLLAAFALLNLLILVMTAGLRILPNNSSLENVIAGMPSMILTYTLPVMVLFALAMLVSNLSLLRHEGRTWRNLLGSLIGFALSLAALAILLNSGVSGSIEEVHLHDFLVNLLSGLVLWTECKMAGIIFCGARAAGRQPAMDKDYVLILGCQLSRKGGLTPLLRGRVDRALAFARQQQEKMGHMPVLIPCGGKGTDEMRSEAAAMREYLLEQGVPEEGILPEDRSVNTWENIRNAQAMMTPGARVAYSTTNYHVFRAGVWASRNGLEAEGMGSRTKWYYWPNAFMREYVALIAANLPHELIMIAIIGIQSGLLAYLYH